MTHKLTTLIAIMGLFGLNGLPADVAQAAATTQAACPSLEDSGIELGQTVKFTPSNDLVAWRKSLKTDAVIYINGFALDKDKVKLVGESPNRPCYHFNLSRQVMTGDLWDSLRNREKSDFLTRRVTLAFGGDDGISSAVPAQDVTLTLVSKTIFVGWIVFFMILLGCMVILGKKSDLLKDRQADAAIQTYSLAKTQMAFWFVLVALAIVFVWKITGGVEELNTSILMLMGISAVTFLGSTAIGSDASADKGPEVLAKKAKKSFFMQLISDHEGVRLHRFQMAVWTLVFGIIFVAEVLRNLVMPEFGGTILGLMGISSVTYLGMKFPELKT